MGGKNRKDGWRISPSRGLKGNLYLAALVLVPAACAAAVFLSTLKNGLVWDSRQYILFNPFLRLELDRFLESAFTSFYADNYHPLTWVSHRLDIFLYGDRPWGHHLGNVIIHGANAGLVAVVTGRISSIAGESKPREFHVLTGLLAGILFGVHPLRVQSVAWVAERKDVLCGFFFLVSVLAHINYARGGKVRYYATSLAAALLALMAKPMAVSLPLVLLILDYYPLGRLRPGTKRASLLLEKVPFLLLALAFSVVTFFAQESGGATEALSHSRMGMRPLVAARGVLFYLEKTILPLGLAPLHPYPRSPAPVHFVSVFLLAVAAVCVIAKRRTQPWLLAVFLYYIVTLAPVLGAVQVGKQAAADRYSYLPILGPMILASSFWAQLVTGSNRRVGRAAQILFVAVVFTLAALTHRQIGFWRDNVTLWSRQTRVYPNEATGYNNLGVGLEEAGRHEEALASYDKAVAAHPDYVEGLVNRARMKRRFGDLKGALRDLDKALTLRPATAKVVNSRAIVLDLMGRREDAQREFERAISMDTRYLEAYFNLALFHVQRENYREADSILTRRLELDPFSRKSWELKSRILAGLGDLQAAERARRKAASLNPTAGR